MFWKTVNRKIPSLSLVNQMILFYSLTTISIVVFVCLILFPTFEKVTHVYNTAYQDHLFSQCIIKLTIALLFGAISAVIFSSLITKKGMKKIDDLSEKIKNISIDSLTTRIKTGDLPNELIPLGESFNLMLDKLHNSFNQISQFSSDIAHELRDPLNNLLGINEVALTHQYSLDKYRETCESTLEEGRYLLKLIENLWFIAQSDHSQLPINKSLINIKTEMLNLIEYYEPYAVEYGIQLACEVEALLHANVLLFKRALSNLLSNALKYTPSKGKINIQIKSTKEYVILTINDSGSGIDEKHLPKLFNRFYRVDNSRSSHTGGLGLGLAIVKSIMDLHQGTISINSKVNSGTSISLNFPINF
jgi:two-component system heavy metal sensor histidine kinase CusS